MFGLEEIPLGDELDNKKMCNSNISHTDNKPLDKLTQDNTDGRCMEKDDKDLNGDEDDLQNVLTGL